MSTKLTDTQLVMLSAAAQRNDRLLEIPANLKGVAVPKVSAKLLAAGLAKEINAKPGSPIWRRDAETSKSYALKLTAAGAKAIASGQAAEVEVGHESGPARERANPEASREAARTGRDSGSVGSDPSTTAGVAPEPNAPRDGTKLALVVDLLRRDQGATLAELVAATDWLPHTARAALTGLRKRGYPVTIDRSTKERGSTYRVPARGAAAAVAPAEAATEPECGPAPAAPGLMQAGNSRGGITHEAA